MTRYTPYDDDDDDEPSYQGEDGYECYDYDGSPLRFADPGGNSALRASSRTNPRNLPCPTCGEPNRLTPRDRALGYQCDACADRTERGMDY